MRRTDLISLRSLVAVVGLSVLAVGCDDAVDETELQDGIGNGDGGAGDAAPMADGPAPGADAGTGGGPGTDGGGAPGSADAAGDAMTGPFSIAVQPGRLRVTPGTNHSIDVTVTRGNGFAGPVTLEVRNLPDRVMVEPVTIAADATMGRLALRVAMEAVPTGVQTRIQVGASGGGVSRTHELPFELFGRSGTVDLTLGTSGVASFDPGPGEEEVHAVAVRPDGKLVAVGGGAAGPFVVRLQVDGTVDPTFGMQGYQRIDAPGGAFTAVTLLAPSGQIVVAGHARRGTGDVLAMRLLEDGAVDTAFGGDGTGRIWLDLGTDETVSGLAVRSDGKFLISGSSTRDGGQFFLARLKTDGTADESFYNSGTKEFPVGAQPRSSSLRLQADGGVLLFGSAGMPSDAVILRLKPDGEVDTAFGTQGVLTLANPVDDDQVHGAIIDAQERIVVAGLNPGSGTVFVTRLTAQGALDSAFGIGGGGRVILSPGAGTVPSGGIALAGRSLLVGGQLPAGGGISAFVARLGDNGSPDNTFGMNAVASQPLGAGGAVRSMALASDGRIVVVGSTAEGGERRPAVVRYWP
jgi:uncharacterized delta-60 repeat protein